MGTPGFLDAGRKCWRLGSERWTLEPGRWLLGVRLWVWTLHSEFWACVTKEYRKKILL